jgi:hypothetical protein
LSQEQLLANLTRDTAYKIRRARDRDKITCDFWNPRDSTVMDEFAEKYNAFAAAKGLQPLNRMRLNSIAAAGLLELTVAKDPQGTPLVVHANLRDRQRASGLELLALYRTLSDSAARNLVGRANRYLTWTDILRYKEQGLRFFDFGGWYHGSEPAMLRVNEFKKGFGGQVLREYECEQVLTVKGRVVLTTAAMLNQIKCAAAKLRSAAGRREADMTVTDAKRGSPC